MKCLPSFSLLYAIFVYCNPCSLAQGHADPFVIEEYGQASYLSPVGTGGDAHSESGLPFGGQSQRIVESVSTPSDRKFVRDSIASTNYEGSFENILQTSTYKITYVVDGEKENYETRDTNGDLLAKSTISTAYNADSSFVKTVILLAILDENDLWFGVYDTVFLTETYSSRNGGTLRKRTSQTNPGDGSEPGEISYSARYDSLSTSNDTLFKGRYTVDYESEEILSIQNSLKRVSNTEGFAAFTEDIYYESDTVYRKTVIQSEYDQGRLVRQTQDESDSFASRSAAKYTEYIFTYIGDEYRITLSTAISKVSDTRPYIQTVVDDYDVFGSMIRTRRFAAYDTTAIPTALNKRTFVGEGDFRVLTRDSAWRYNDDARRLEPTQVHEVFWKSEGTPVSTTDVVQRKAEPCDMLIDADGIRVQAPAGAHLTLVDVVGRTTWSTRVPGIFSGTDALTTFTVPTPAPGSGLHVLTGRGSGWRCATKVVR